MRTFNPTMMDTTYRPLTLLLLLVLPLVLLTGCDSNPLEEDPQSVVTPDQFYETEEEFRAALAPVYAQLRDVAQWDIYDLQEHSSDEIMVPTRGGDWGDGGIWRELTQHRWDATHPAINGAWGIAFSGVARANSVLGTLQATETDLEEADQFTAELRFLRAFYYYHLMDLYGNVPIVVEEGSEYEDEFPTQPIPADDPPEQRSRAEVFSFILQELTGCTLDEFDESCVTSPEGALAEMPAKGDVDYGRATQGAAYALLARLLINGEVYSGDVTSDGVQGGQTFWAEASAAAQEVINSGDYALEDDYFANFTVDNQGSSENVFVASYTNDDPLGFQKHMGFLHYNQLPQTPWNGFTTIADFYSSFEIEPGDDGELGTRDDVKNDDRARQFLAGQMYAEPSAGCQADECWSDEESGRLEDRSDRDLRFTLEIPSIEMGSGNSEVERAGIRPLKWEIDADRDAVHMANDFPLIRLAEMYLIQAEAENEQGNTGEAVNLIDDLRDRANAPSYDGPTDQDAVRSAILQERGYELHAEGIRRQDLIRYEVSGGSESDDPYAPTFTGEWLFKDPSDGHRMLFPIPQNQLDANPNLEQNPGYGG